MNAKVRHLPTVAIAAITGLFLWVFLNLYSGKEHYRTLLQADACGYYAYLPAIFIHHDLQFGQFETIENGKYHATGRAYDYRVRTSGGIVNKYFCGTALCELPFFLIAHGVVKLAGGEAHGYSRAYILFIGFAALFHLLMGMIFLERLLRLYDIADRDRAIVIAAITLATNMLYYAVVAPGMSHVYSFAWCTFFLWQGKLLFMRFSSRRLVLLGVILGLIVLIRPVNVIVALTLPFLAGRASSLIGTMSLCARHWRAMAAALAAFAAITFVQPMLYAIATGSFFIDSYPGEGFNWSGPHVLDILFSYRKGLFLYAPLLLFATIAGLIVLWRTSRYEAITWLTFFLLLTYVFSSWWNWWYGGGFGGRPYVEFLAHFAVLLGIVLKSTRGSRWRTATLSMIVLFILLCQVQTYQARYYQIDVEGMDRQRYWREFLRIDRLGCDRNVDPGDHAFAGTLPITEDGALSHWHVDVAKCGHLATDPRCAKAGTFIRASG